MQLLLEQLHSPIGAILLVSDDDAVRAVDFLDHEPRLHRLLLRHYGACPLRPATRPTWFGRSLDRYFAGDLAALDEIPVRTGGSVFQREVWAALRRIPASQTISYGQLADLIGRPGASRAVGLANGSNPVSIVVPCHRVIGADQLLTGYGGGLERKAWLLAHERPRLL